MLAQYILAKIPSSVLWLGLIIHFKSCKSICRRMLPEARGSEESAVYTSGLYPASNECSCAAERETARGTRQDSWAKHRK